MKQEHIDRLAKLAEHLEKGQLGHATFDFAVVNNSLEASCGTAGCALGELPIVWPLCWSWNYGGIPYKIGVQRLFEEDACDFFGIDQEEMDHLFYPALQRVDVYGGKKLNRSATRYEVAANIRAFIEIKTVHLDNNETAETKD